MTIAKKSSNLGGQKSRSGEISKPLMEKPLSKSMDDRILFQGDFLANHFPLPGNEKASQITVISGLKCLELYPRSSQLTSLVRMFLESSNMRSTRCYLIWKTSVTPRNRLLFRLAPLMPRTGGTGFGFWPTVDTTDGAPNKNSNKRNGPKSLIQVAKEMWPIPKEQNARGSGERHGQGVVSLDVAVGGKLNPTWVEWLMGLPIGWTDLNCSETAKSFRSFSGSEKK